MTTQSDRVQFGKTEIAYEIRRSANRRTVAITVCPDQSIQVVAPKGLRRSRIAPIVKKKAAWIVGCWEQNGRAYRSTEKSLVSGESLRYLGRQYPLVVHRAKTGDSRASVKLVRGRFCVTVRSNLSVEDARSACRNALEAWYRLHAESQLAQLVERISLALRVRFNDVQVREFAKRWGSASNGVIRLNWRIIMAPRRVVEYIVAHELCHLRHDNHSPAFWRMLSSFMPDYRERRSELACIGPLLDL